ncbi:MAG TPA: AarF/ABC1/UbiB kinase family protein [Anaerolineaceae bacterium]|nr:AarF/ABC1/UbiB kinase family protein [Anaerolineaceae bacterium]
MADNPSRIPWLTRRALFGRSRQILTVLTRHGLGWLYARGVSGPLRHRTHGPLSNAGLLKEAEHLRQALVELGATFIKLGQALSSRPDILPAEYIDELSRLVDEIPPLPFSRMEQVFRAELNCEIEDLFSEFERCPMASASIGQVYAARLKNGQRVVVKIQRPGVVQTIEQDLEILSDMAEFISQNTELGRRYDIPSLVEEFSYRIRLELDYQREGRNADIFRRNFYGDDSVRIPKIYWDVSTARVLTLEEVGGYKINDIQALDAAGLNRRVVAENASRFTLRMIFEFGFFHADPHTGNIFVQPDGTLAIVDFGMVGRLNEKLKRGLLQMSLAVARGDIERVVDELLEAGITGKRVRVVALRHDLERLLEGLYVGTFKEMTATDMTAQIMNLAIKHELQLPAEMVMLVRLLAISEGIAAQLCPDFHLIEFAVPYVKKFLAEGRKPEEILSRLGQTGIDGIEFGLELPRQASRLLKMIERGQVEMNISFDGLRPFMSQMQRMANRVAIAIILGATIIALGLVMVIYRPESWKILGDLIFGMAFLFSLGFGFWLMWSIFRSGR